MTASAAVPGAASEPGAESVSGPSPLMRLGAVLDGLVVPSAAVLVSAVLFGGFVALAGANPLEVYEQMYRGAFGTWFSVQNSLQRAAPLMLTGLCTALPAIGIPARLLFPHLDREEETGGRRKGVRTPYLLSPNLLAPSSCLRV